MRMENGPMMVVVVVVLGLPGTYKCRAPAQEDNSIHPTHLAPNNTIK